MLQEVKKWLRTVKALKASLEQVANAATHHTNILYPVLGIRYSMYAYMLSDFI
jgi:hypothetical protein